MGELAGKVALVTGAGSGIGKATAVRMASEGAQIGVLSHTTDEINETAEEIRRSGGDATVLTADVADADAMKNAIDALARRYGRLDIVVANAASTVPGRRSTSCSRTSGIARSTSTCAAPT